MAANAAERRLVEQAEEELQRTAEHRAARAARDAALAALPEGADWLNGWPQIGDASVLMGTGVRCVGCGRLRGVTCVVFDDDWRAPGPEPQWRFAPETCPICPPDGYRPEWAPDTTNT
jgi:hypothetical protein